MNYQTYKTYKTYPRWAVWTLTVLLALQSFSGMVIAQEEQATPDQTTEQTTIVTETSNTSEETSTSESSQTTTSQSSGNFEMPTIPEIPEIANLMQNWNPNGVADEDDPPEVEEPDDDANETPPDPSPSQGEDSGGGIVIPQPTIPQTPSIPSISNPLSDSAWWQGLIPNTSSGSGSSQTAQDILDLWKRSWVPTEEKEITTPGAGSGETTGGITSPAATSTPTSTEVALPNDVVHEIKALNATSTSTTTPGAEANNSDNTGEGNFTNSDTVQTDTSIETTNISDVTNREVIGSDSGNNTLEFGQRGEGGITTGQSSATAKGDFELNTTEVRETGEMTPDQTGCADCWAVWNMGSVALNENTSEDSANQATADVDRDYTVVNTNIAYLGNDYLISGNSGHNRVRAGFSFKDGWVETGNVKVRSNIINKVNTNIIDFNGVKAIWRPFVLDINGEYDEDIDLFELIASRFGGTRGIFANANNTNTGEDSLNLSAASIEENTTVEVNNQGLIENDYAIVGSSGANSIFAGTKVKRTRVDTGNVDVSTNLFNLVNTNIIGSEATVAVINIFGNFKKNILLPSFDQIFPSVGPRIATDADASASIEGATGDSINNAVAIATNDTEITVQNWGGVNNELKNVGNTGNNENVFGDDVDNINVKTGKAKTQTNVLTLANRTCIGCGWFSGFFNILGDWSGRVSGLPDAAKREGNGKSFVVSVEDTDVPGLGGVGVAADASVNGAGDDSFNGSAAVAQRSVKIKTTNEGAVINKLDQLADSGSNTIAAIDGKDINVNTGDVSSAMNVGTILNTDVIGGKLVTLAINLFGSWDGDFVIGEPTDVSVALTATPTPNPAAIGGSIQYQISVDNAGDGKMTDARVEVTYDHAKTTLVDAGAGSTGEGSVSFTFPQLAPGTSAHATFRVSINETLGSGTHILTANAVVSSSTADRNAANDQSSASVTLLVSQPGGVDPGNNNDEGTVGGTILPGNTNTNQNTNPPAGGNAGTNVGSAASGSDTILGMTKTSTASASGVAPGSTVPYKITLQNNRSVPVHDVKVYDKLKNEDGMVVIENSWDLGIVAPNEKVVIDYTVIFSPDAPTGAYTNTAYASGFDQSNTVIRSSNVTYTIRLALNAPLLEGTIENAGSGGVNNAGSMPSNANAPSSEVPSPELTGNPSREGYEMDGNAEGDPYSNIFVDADDGEPITAEQSVKEVAKGAVVRTIGVKSASAAGLNAGILASSIDDAQSPLTPELSAALPLPSNQLIMRTIIFGLLSLLFFFLAFSMTRHRRKTEASVAHTPYWFL
ncbi:MAG: hypothetical protein AB1352_02440 [Patescibacteria group bacterium]